MENPLISIIVPIFNVEAYLNRCVESIVNQTYQKLEIILVDDGSPDNCPRMCDDWAKKDSRIKVIHKENGGLSDARNAGMKITTGEYISFIDSDDYIETCMIEILYEAIKKYDCDIASCRVRIVMDDKPSIPLTSAIDNKKVFDNSLQSMEDLINGKHLLQTVWNKLYRKKTIENIEFPINKINEDEFWTWKAIANSKRVVCVNSILYNYYLRSGSIMQGGINYSPMPVLEAKYERLKFIETNMPALRNVARVDLLNTCLFQALRSKRLLQRDDNQRYFKEIKKIANQCCPDIEYVKSLKLKKRLRVISLCHCFRFVFYAQNILGIGNKSNI
ncbi:glycosyltransferase [Ruminococcus sp. JL13D9]|uniref:glycosyltransferase n=1 Tax=Ruminococcus sp. JL13D9 TaxID=3233381 RepID=UPI003899D7C7